MLTDTAQSLEKAFEVFQLQSERLEQTHRELQHKLETTELSLEKKNIELAQRINETEVIKSNLLGILESIDDAVFLISPTRSVKVANRAATALLSNIGQIDLLYNPQLDAHIRSGQAVRDEDIEIDYDGDIHTLILSVIHMPGKTSGDVVISLRDVTEQRRLQTVAARNDRMSALGQVAASVAHEIRNPLGAIEGFATLLTRDLAEDPNAQRLAEKTVYAAQQLNSVVTNMLTYTREVVLHALPQDLNTVIQQALGLVKPQTDDSKATVELNLSEKPLIADIDQVQLNQVIINLITNAIEACPYDQQGVVKISSYTTKNFICLEVSDNGEGVRPERKQHIFDPFYSKKEGGIGLGLALCRRIVDAHCGTIFENGEYGTGACFTVKLNKSESHRD